MPYSYEITSLRSQRLRPFAAVAFADARQLETSDLLAIIGREAGYRQGVVAAAAEAFKDRGKK